MAERESLGPVQVLTNEPGEINDALRQLSERIDELRGLRGRAQIHDRVAVGTPSVSDDAAQFGASSSFVTLATTQTITGQKTVKGVLWRFTDSTDTLIHAFGTKT